MSYHRINRAAEEGRLLQEMLQLQSQIRTQNEAKRRRNENRTEKYTKMFEPVTKSIAKLTAHAHPTANLLNLPNAQLDEPVLEPVKIEPKEEPVKEEERFFDEPNNELFRQALALVPENLRDDGLLGLDINTHTIGSYTYEVQGNILQCVSEDGGDEASFEIDNLELWMLLIVKNPNKVALKLKQGKDYSPFVYDFKDIADRLELVATSGHFSGFKLRKKYKVLEELHHAGSGFLFSVQPPDTVVVPSDIEGLMTELYTALAELRAGNTSMVNMVVPLAAEAKRLGCLPENLLSPDEETWVFA